MDVTMQGAHAPDMTLDEYGPMSHWGKVFWQRDDGKVACGLWEVDAGRFSCAFDGEGEIVHVVKGTIVATEDSGSAITLRPGDVYTFTPAWKGVWEMRESMRKFFTTFHQ